MSSGFTFGQRSRANFLGVHHDLVAVMTKALSLSSVDFTVTEGVRTRARQEKLVAEGASRTMDSKHLPQPDGFGHAVDVAALVDGKVSWDWKYYEAINDAVQQAAREMGVKVTWGGTWKTLKDGPHFQIEGV